MQPALSTTGRWHLLLAVAVTLVACGGKGGLRLTGGNSGQGGGVVSSGGAGGETTSGLGGSGGGSTEEVGGSTSTGAMANTTGGATSQGGGAGTDQDGAGNDSAVVESPDSSGDDSVVVIDAGTGCPPAPPISPRYPSQLLTDPATGCVVSVFYTNSDAGVNCPPLNLPPTLCISSLLPLTDPITGCATGFECAFPSDCVLGAGCPITDGGVACPPVVFPTQFCIVLLTVVDPTTGCVVGFTCKWPGAI